MASRKHLPPQRRDPSRSSNSFSASSTSSSSSSLRLIPLSVLEDRIIAQDRKIQFLLHDNQRLAANQIALRQDLADAKRELRLLLVAAEEVKARRDAEVREVYEKSLKLDAEVRAIDEMSAELVQVRGDVQKLTAIKRDLATELQEIEADLVRALADSQKVSLITSEIEAVRGEIERGRVSVECEKKTRASNIQHSKTMDKNMVTMVAEIEKLRMELENAEKRTRVGAFVATANPSPGYPLSYGNPELGNRVSYPDFYRTPDMR